MTCLVTLQTNDIQILIHTRLVEYKLFADNWNNMN